VVQPNPCSLVILTKDSSLTLSACITSGLEIASEVILVDNFSKDSTLDIAKKFEARIFQRDLESFGAQKQFAIDQAKNDWIFLLDSDEEISPPLLNEIKKTLENPTINCAYKVPRKNFYLGSFLRFGGKYPDYQTRLFKKSLCHFSKDIVHEKVMANGVVGKLSKPIFHYSYPDIETWVRKLDLFARKNAEKWEQEGVRPSLLNFFTYCLLNPSSRFIRRYFLKGGFLDGLPGLLACIHDVLTEILSYSLINQNKEKK